MAESQIKIHPSFISTIHKEYTMKLTIAKIIIALLVLSNAITAYSYAHTKYMAEQSICTKAETTYNSAKDYATSKFNNLFN